MDVAQAYPGRDPWLYRVDSTHRWPERTYIPEGGSRGAYKCFDPETGDLGCLRYESRSYLGISWKEKVVCDLACILDLPIPVSLLMPKDASDMFGNVSRWVPGDPVPLKLWCRTFPEKTWKDMVAAAYPYEAIPFDLWVGNVDRHGNDGNIVVTSNADGSDLRVFPIDYDLCLGSKGRWDNDGYKNPPDPEHLPYPRCISGRQWDKDRIFAGLDRILKLDCPVIIELGKRAAVYCDREPELSLVERTYEALQVRRERLSDWIQGILPA